MDALYDNLENYNEETTIAELRSENKELKSKLEEYASTLEILQKDFDKLSSEYKKLELNYSSLLKTAKAEVDRKSLLITNLNIEKDKMVLKFHENRNAGAFRRSSVYDANLARNIKEDRSVESENDSKIENENVRKPPPTERKEQGQQSHNDTRTNLTSRLHNMANTMPRQVDPRIEKSSDLKKNIIQPKTEDDKLKSRALIRNRRKSMPAVSYEMDKVSSDDGDDMASTGSSREVIRENTYKKYVDRNLSDKQISRISETSSYEDKNFGYQKPLHDAHKTRYSRYDRDKNESSRTRDKSSYRNKRRSPERYETKKRDHDDRYHRSERERCVKVESLPGDRFHWQRNRESRRSNYERNYPHEHERLQHRSQERYHNMKHKIQHSYVDSDSKRMKIESHYRQHEENPRLPDEKEFLCKKNIKEPDDNIQFSSCESPDYNHSEVSTHQIREIKLTATTKLDDPRTTNKKYILEKNDGKVALFTTDGRNVDMMPVKKTAWGILPVSMPNALVKRPSLEVLQPAKEYMDIENPEVNISLESGEIDDFKCLDTLSCPKDTPNENKLPKIAIPILNIYESKNIEDSLQKIKRYKIGKIKKTVEGNQSGNNTKEVTTLDKPTHEKTATFISTLSSKNSESAFKNIDEGKQLKPANSNTLLEQNKQDIFFTKSNNELPFLGNSDLNDKHNYASAKEIVEGDLELSDDDNNEQPIPITKESDKVRLENNKNDKIQSSNIVTEKDTTSPSEKRVEYIKNNKNDNSGKKDSGEMKREKEKVERHKKDTKTDDSKKSKSKKKLKHKEPKEQLENKDSTQASEKQIKKKEKVKETKTKQIKTKFSELFDDSSSLISPEDLGLAVVPPPTIQLPDRCVPIFEDAQDADLNIIKAAMDSNPSGKLHKNECNHDSEIMNIRKIDTPVTIIKDSVNKINELEPVVNEEVIESVYKNLEPSIPEKEDDVVRTVIISTGIQPQILVEAEKQELASKIEPQIKNASKALKALATSTPHKVANVMQSEEVKLPDTSCNSNGSQMLSVDNTSAVDKSDTNMVVSQTNGPDVPDVRIIVRRRKVIKK